MTKTHLLSGTVAVLTATLAVVGQASGARVSATTPTRAAIATSASTGASVTYIHEKVIHSAGVRPDSHFGCNQIVCINVVGTSLYVDDVSTDGFPAKETCATDVIEVNGVPKAVGLPVLCGGPSDTFFADWPVEAYFANGSQICAVWVDDINGRWQDLIPAIPGKPCATVHS